MCVEPVLSLTESLNSPLAQERGWIVDVPLQNNTADTEPQLACPIKFSRSKMRYSFIGQNLVKGSGKELGPFFIQCVLRLLLD